MAKVPAITIHAASTYLIQADFRIRDVPRSWQWTLKRNDELRDGHPDNDCSQESDEDSLMPLVLGETCDEASDGENGESYGKCVELPSDPDDQV